MQKLSALSANITANSAAIVTAMATPVQATAAEVAAIAEVLLLLGRRKDLLFPLLRIANGAKNQIQPE